jgi:hypothetical protein
MREQYIKKNNWKYAKKEKMKVEFKQKKVEQRWSDANWKNAKLKGQNGTLGSNKMEVEAPNKT